MPVQSPLSPLVAPGKPEAILSLNSGSPHEVIDQRLVQWVVGRQLNPVDAARDTRPVKLHQPLANRLAIPVTDSFTQRRQRLARLQVAEPHIAFQRKIALPR